MNTIQALEDQRNQILEKMKNIRSLKRGSITEQFLKVAKKGQQATRCGPYYVLSRRIEGKTSSKRLKPGHELEQARQDIQRHQEFVQLCRQFEQLTEQLGELERVEPQEKKRRRSPLSKTGSSQAS